MDKEDLARTIFAAIVLLTFLALYGYIGHSM